MFDARLFRGHRETLPAPLHASRRSLARTHKLIVQPDMKMKCIGPASTRAPGGRMTALTENYRTTRRFIRSRILRHPTSWGPQTRSSREKQEGVCQSRICAFHEKNRCGARACGATVHLVNQHPLCFKLSQIREYSSQHVLIAGTPGQKVAPGSFDTK